MSHLSGQIASAAIVESLDPVLRATSAKSESDRTFAPEAAEAMVSAGVFASLIPRELGGLDLDIVEALRLFEEIARINGSAGWLAANQSGQSTILAELPELAAREILAEGPVVFAGALFPPGEAVRENGGYRVTGRWPFASGCDFANWMLGIAVAVDPSGPAPDPDGPPPLIIAVFPAGEARIIDTWNTLGMRGTGSKDIEVENLFVPEERCWMIGPMERPSGVFSSPIFGMGFWPIAAAQAAVAVGIARAAVDDLIALASKTPAFLTTSLGDRPSVQATIARARSRLDAARSYLYVAGQEAWDYCLDVPLLAPELGISLSLAGVYAMETSAEVVQLVHSCAGTSAIRNEYCFQQYLRDIMTLTQHAHSSTSRYESLGKLLLGRETDWAFYA